MSIPDDIVCPYGGGGCGSGTRVATPSYALPGVCRGARISAPLESPSGILDREEAVSAALQLQHDAGLIMSNLQVLGQFVMSPSRMSSEVMRLVFGQEQFPSVAVQAISPSPRICRAAHYMAAMGLWRPPGGPVLPGLYRLLHAITVCGVLIASRPWTDRTMSPGGEFSVHMNF